MMTAEFDLAEVNKLYDEMSKRGHDLRPVFKKLQTELKEDLKQHAREGQGPQGAWPALAASTMKKYLAEQKTKPEKVTFVKGKLGSYERNAHTLKNITRKGFLTARAARHLAKPLGRLPGMVAYRMGSNFLEGFDTVPFSGVQNDGGPVGRGSKLPARIFMWMSYAFIERARSAVLLFVTGAPSF